MPLPGTLRLICRAMGRRELVSDPRFHSRESRMQNREAVDEIMNAWTRTRTVAENVALLESMKLSAGPILNVEQIYRDPQFGQDGARPMFCEMQHPKLGTVEYTGPVPRLSDTPTTLQRPSPALGQHNEEILQELGYSLTEIEVFRADGII